MKCPNCKSHKYSTIKTDPSLMGCEDCHGVNSVSWGIGYWIGYLEGEHTRKRALNILKLYNPLRNDLDAYLLDIIEWGLGECERPDPKDFGLQEEKQK